MDIFSRFAPTRVAAAMPRLSAALSSQPPSAHRPSGLEYTVGEPVQRGQFGVGVAQHLAAHFDRIGTGRAGQLRTPELAVPAHLGRAEGRQRNQDLEDISGLGAS
jgi:hypothetical protein